MFFFCAAPSAELSDYAASLYARRESGGVVPVKDVPFDGEMPRPNFCHGNSEWWVLLHPDWKVARGWLFIPVKGAQWSRFVSHSVVRSPEGELHDITPQPKPPKYAFLHSELCEEKYIAYKDALFAAHGLGFLDHTQPE